MTGFAEHCISGQIAALKENSTQGLFGWDSSTELNTKKLENSSIFPLVTYSARSEQQFRSYIILCISNTAETVWDRTAAGRNKILETKLPRNSGGSEYKPDR
jgi:hypothetical protein